MRGKQRRHPVLLAALLSIVATNVTVPTSVCASPNVLISRADEGKSVRLLADQTMVVRLPARPGTGYQWILAQPLAFLTLVKSDFEGGGLPGGLEEQVLYFRASGAGEGRLVFHYMQPWAKGTPPDQVFTLRVTASQP